VAVGPRGHDVKGRTSGIVTPARQEDPGTRLQDPSDPPPPGRWRRSQ
jgi:hypothetical protein